MDPTSLTTSSLFHHFKIRDISELNTFRTPRGFRHLCQVALEKLFVNYVIDENAEDKRDKVSGQKLIRRAEERKPWM